MTKIISVLNEKGGVGKTTTVLELAFQLGTNFNKKCLIVDMDAQANATKRLTGCEWDSGLFDLMVKGGQVVEFLQPARDAWKNVIVLPADRRLGVIEPHLVTKLNRESILKTVLAPLNKRLDYILIDLPPRVDTLTINALVASDAYLVPCDLSYDGRDGARMINETADILRKAGNNPNLEFIGVALTSFQKGGSLAVRGLIQEFEDEFKEKLLDVRIPDRVAVTTAQKEKIPVGFLDPESDVSLSYKQLAEVIQ